MRGEWGLTAMRSFSSSEECKWKSACNLLCQFAEERGFLVAHTVEEAIAQGLIDEYYHRYLVCPLCPEPSGIFIIWHPVRIGCIAIPLTLNYSPHCYSATGTWRQQGFQVRGRIKWKTTVIGSVLEEIIGFLFPGSFKCMYVDSSNKIFSDIVSDREGKNIQTFPEKLASQLRTIKSTRSV